MAFTCRQPLFNLSKVFRQPALASFGHSKPAIRNLALKRGFASAAPAASSPLRAPLLLGGLLGATAFSLLPTTKPAVQCDVAIPRSFNGPAPRSNVSIQSLGFGSAAGICAGIFVAKGLKALAFLLGGAFVMLQFLNGRAWTTTNWNKISSAYESTVDKLAASTGGPEKGAAEVIGGRVSRIFHRGTEFLMADFPQRATFLAGFVLGLRMG